MTPVEPTCGDGQPVVYGAEQPQYIPLPARRTDDGDVITEWSLTEEERQRVAHGENIRLRVKTFNHPIQPVMIEITSEQE